MQVEFGFKASGNSVSAQIAPVKEQAGNSSAQKYPVWHVKTPSAESTVIPLKENGNIFKNYTLCT